MARHEDNNGTTWRSELEQEMRYADEAEAELCAAEANLDYATREYNAGRITLRVLDMARERLARAQA